jgi:hypothetical protein
VTKFTTCHASTEGIVAYRDCVVFECISKVIIAFCHGANEDANALFGSESLDVILDTYYGAFEGESNLTAVWWKVFGDWVFDHAKEFFLGSRGSDGHAVEKLDHETSESLECTRNADGRIDFDEDAFRGVYVNLEFAGLVNGRVEEGKEALEGSVFAVSKDQIDGPDG